MRFLKNKVKMKLRQGESSVGSWISLPSVETFEIMARSGAFDFLVMDAEHSVLQNETIQKMNMIAESYDVMPLVRISQNKLTVIKQSLETGCYGLVVPNVNSKKDVQSIIDGVFYKPVGQRGVGLSRAQGYGLSFDEYLRWLEKNMCIIVQIEDIRAIQNLRDILDNDMVDASMIGPYDLSASLGCAGKLGDDRVIDALKEYERVSVEMSKPYGYHITHSDAKLLKDKASQGYSFLVYGVDQIMLAEQCKKSRSLIYEINGDHTCQI